MRRARSWGEILLLGGLYLVVRPPARLFAVNQNTYFLHGLKNGGFDLLRGDWLANTTDPTPVLSALVALTNRFLTPAAFYALHALTAGVYFFTLLNIAAAFFKLDGVRRVRLAAWLLILHAVLLNGPWFANGGASMLTDGLANQFLMHDYLQPSSFGIFLLLAIDAFLIDRFGWTGIFLALAATFHATYLLPAAILFVGFLWAAWRENRAAEFLRRVAPGLALAAPIVIYTVIKFAPTNAAIGRQATEILADQRLPWHTRPQVWFHRDSEYKLAMIAVALFVTRGTRLGRAFLGATVAALALSLVQIASGSRQLALLFPWRISVALVPLAAALILGWLHRPREIAPVRAEVWRRAAVVATAAVFLLACGVGLWSWRRETRKEATDPERTIAALARLSAAPNQRYLVPILFEKFRLSAGLPTFVDWKSHPYKDKEVIEWRRRIEVERRIFNDKGTADCAYLAAAAREEQLTHVVAPLGHPLLACSDVRPLDSNGVYALAAIDAGGDLSANEPSPGPLDLH